MCMWRPSSPRDREGVVRSRSEIKCAEQRKSVQCWSDLEAWEELEIDGRRELRTSVKAKECLGAWSNVSKTKAGGGPGPSDLTSDR